MNERRNPERRAESLMQSVGRLEGKVDSVLERLDRFAERQKEIEDRTTALEHKATALRTYMRIGAAVTGILATLILKLLVFTTYVQVSIPPIPKQP